MRKNNWSHINSLIRYSRGECTTDEAEWIAVELNASPSLQYVYDKLKRVVELERDIDIYKICDVEAAYRQTRRRIKINREVIRIGRFRNWQAAAILLPFFFSLMVITYLYVGELNDPVMTSEVSTAPGTIGRYELPDKSIVWLNAGSKLRFPTRFDKKVREVELWGEGFFDVNSDKNRPFYVKTEEGSRVYAYGTRFNVNAYSDNDFIETVLEEGKVNVLSPKGETSAVLRPGQRAHFCKLSNVMTVQATSLSNKLAWKEGKMVFRSATLEEIFKKLSRHYNVDIEFSKEVEKEYRFRATFKNETVYQILDYLKKTAPLDWTLSEASQNSDSTFTKQSIHVVLKREPE